MIWRLKDTKRNDFVNARVAETEEYWEKRTYICHECGDRFLVERGTSKYRLCSMACDQRARGKRNEAQTIAEKIIRVEYHLRDIEMLTRFSAGMTMTRIASEVDTSPSNATVCLYKFFRKLDLDRFERVTEDSQNINAFRKEAPEFLKIALQETDKQN